MLYYRIKQDNHHGPALLTRLHIKSFFVVVQNFPHKIGHLSALHETYREMFTHHMISNVPSLNLIMF